MANSILVWQAIFDDVNILKVRRHFPVYLAEFSAFAEDFACGVDFLLAYKDLVTTFITYRREIERLFQWSWRIAKRSVLTLKREDIENYLNFCENPPVTWIGLSIQTRFIEHNGIRMPNPKWRPFVAKISKAKRATGATSNIKNFNFTNNSIKELLAILSSFYLFLIQEEKLTANPILLMRQKSKFIRKQQGAAKIRRLTTRQLQYLMATCLHLAQTEPQKHERTLFMISLLYGMYLRISELAASTRWTPQMNHFFRDEQGAWWFTTVGKGNKQRSIAVSDAVLKALIRWRTHLGLSPLPSVADDSPLLPKNRGRGPINSTRSIRKLVQYTFDCATAKLRTDGHSDEADSLMYATVHWLRHTGISDDVKIRPREHVRDDAGHSSSATTDKYIDISLKERHASAEHKALIDRATGELAKHW